MARTAFLLAAAASAALAANVYEREVYEKAFFDICSNSNSASKTVLNLPSA